MDLLTIIPIALGLAMDAFAVAIAASVTLGQITGRHVFRLSFHFGLFQALMPVVGWAAGLAVAPYIQQWDHWVAFGLLALIGGRAIFASLRGGEKTDGRLRSDPTRGVSLVALSVATSIDALAVGLSFSALGVDIVLPVLVIGVTAAAMTVLGMAIGVRLGQRFGRVMELAGGLVLLGIGLKIVIEHYA